VIYTEPDRRTDEAIVCARTKAKKQTTNFILLYTQNDGEEEESSSFSLSGCHFFVGQTNNRHRQFQSFFVHSKNDLSSNVEIAKLFELHKIVYTI
jgi:hypothetical protein